MMNIEDKKEEIIGTEFQFHKLRSIDVNWTNSLSFEPKLDDCSINDSIEGLEIYVVCLKNGVLPDDKSILFYNNYSTEENSLIGDYGTMYCVYPGCDQSFTIYPELIGNKYDEILFIIGRPKSNNSKEDNWIDQDQVKDVVDEICFIDCKIDTTRSVGYISINNIRYEYNKYGAMVQFSLKNNDNWELNLSHALYTDGLFEIVAKHSKSYI